MFIPEKYAALAAQYPKLRPFRVVSQQKGFYRIADGMTELTAEVSGKFIYRAAQAADYPAVGDYVAAKADSDRAVIHEVLPRKSVFARRAAGAAGSEQIIAANIDVIFICMALDADFNLRRLERYLCSAWESGAEPVVVLTKADLCADLQSRLAAVCGVSAGAAAMAVSSMAGDGYARIAPYITAGKTVAFAGSSGVGKSTMINALLGEQRQQTGQLGTDGKGRHTTTRRELIALPNGAMVIDTPGMREFGMWDADDGISLTFADIERIARNCRFGDCTHSDEPGCAVLAAIEAGQLDAQRFASYKKLEAESAYAQDSSSYLEAKREKFRQIAKYNKTNRKR